MQKLNTLDKIWVCSLLLKGTRWIKVNITEFVCSGISSDSYSTMDTTLSTVRTRSNEAGKKDDYLDGLGTIMQNEKFRKFLSEYGSDWSNMKMVFTLIKMYECIEEIYREKMGEKSTTTTDIAIQETNDRVGGGVVVGADVSDKIIGMMRVIMTTSKGLDIRRSMMDEMVEFEKGKPFNNILRNYVDLQVGEGGEGDV